MLIKQPGRTLLLALYNEAENQPLHPLQQQWNSVLVSLLLLILSKQSRKPSVNWISVQHGKKILSRMCISFQIYTPSTDLDLKSACWKTHLNLTASCDFDEFTFFFLQKKLTKKKVLVKSSCIIHGQHGDLFIGLQMETCVEKSWDVRRVSVTSDFTMARLRVLEKIWALLYTAASLSCRKE